MKFSWKTTLGGIASVLAGISGLAGDAWTPTAETLGLIIAGLSLIFAKDHDKSHTQR